MKKLIEILTMLIVFFIEVVLTTVPLFLFIGAINLVAMMLSLDTMAIASIIKLSLSIGIVFSAIVLIRALILDNRS